MDRALGRSFVLWACFAYLTVATVEVLVFGRFEPTSYVPGAIGAGLGLTAADRVVPLRFRRSDGPDSE